MNNKTTVIDFSKIKKIKISVEGKSYCRTYIVDSANATITDNATTLNIIINEEKPTIRPKSSSYKIRSRRLTKRRKRYCRRII